MRIDRYTGNYFSFEDFSVTPKDINNYIPLVVWGDMTYIKGMYYYSKPSFQQTLAKTNTIKNIKEVFYESKRFYSISIQGSVYYFAKGCMFNDRGLPLIVLAMERGKYDNGLNKYQGQEGFSYSNFVMFYSSSFLLNPSLATLHRRLQKELINSCYESGIEVRIISSLEIEKNTFAKVPVIKETDSLSELEHYMNTELPTILYEKKSPKESDTELALGSDNIITPINDNGYTYNILESITEDTFLLDELVREAEEMFGEYDVVDITELTEEQEEDREEIEEHEERSILSHTIIDNTTSIELIDDTE